MSSQQDLVVVDALMQNGRVGGHVADVLWSFEKWHEALRKEEIKQEKGYVLKQGLNPQLNL